MRARDAATIRLLRTVRSALANAEAQPAADRGHEPVIGNGDVARRELPAGEVEAIVRREAEDRRRAAVHYRSGGRDNHAAALRRRSRRRLPPRRPTRSRS